MGFLNTASFVTFLIGSVRVIQGHPDGGERFIWGALGVQMAAGVLRIVNKNLRAKRLTEAFSANWPAQVASVAALFGVSTERPLGVDSLLLCATQMFDFAKLYLQKVQFVNYEKSDSDVSDDSDSDSDSEAEGVEVAQRMFCQMLANMSTEHFTEFMLSIAKDKPKSDDEAPPDEYAVAIIPPRSDPTFEKIYTDEEFRVMNARIKYLHGRIEAHKPNLYTTDELEAMARGFDEEMERKQHLEETGKEKLDESFPRGHTGAIDPCPNAAADEARASLFRQAVDRDIEMGLRPTVPPDACTRMKNYAQQSEMLAATGRTWSDPYADQTNVEVIYGKPDVVTYDEDGNEVITPQFAPTTVIGATKVDDNE